MKKKFNIKEFFLLHIEKFVFGIAIILAVYFMFGGKKLEPLKWLPDDLITDSKRASDHIDTNEVLMKDINIEEKNYAEFAKGIKVGVKLEPYRTPTPWEVSLFPKKPLREKPVLYALERLQGKSGVGAIMVNDLTPGANMAVGTGGTGGSGLTGSAGSTPTKKIGQRWIVLVGDIPIQKQLNEYINTYSGASYTDPMNRDIPKYMYYRIWRQEWPTANVDDWTELDDVYVTYRTKTEVEWPLGAQGASNMEPVDQAYLAPVSLMPMAFPLPVPAGGVGFGDSVGHPPHIPLLKDDLFKEMQAQKKLQKTIEILSKPSVEDIKNFNPFAAGAGASQGSSYDSSPGFGPRSNPGGGGVIRPPNAAVSRLQMERALEEPVRVSHYLFRYFDFNVQPGKTYRYKVKLLLANPNFNLPEKDIAESAMKDRFVTMLETDDSEPSPPITVSLDTRALLSKVESDPAPKSTPKATMRMVLFDMSDSTEWVLDNKPAERGTFLNWSERGYAAEPAPSTTASESDSYTSAVLNRTPAKSTASTDTRTAKFDSNVCLLDIIGGYSLGNTTPFRSPGKILVMEQDGNVVVHDVAEDANEVSDYDKKTAPAATGGSSSSTFI